MKMKKINLSKNLYLLLAFLYLMGNVIGALYAQKHSEGYFSYFISGYLQDHLSGDFLAVFSISFLSMLLCNIILLITGLSSIGMPVIVTAVAVKGIAVGMIAASLYIDQGLKGILAEMLLLWLPWVVQAIILISYGANSIILSSGIFSNMFLHNSIRANNASRFVRQFIIYSSIGLAVSILEASFSVLFSGLFNLA